VSRRLRTLISSGQDSCPDSPLRQSTGQGHDQGRFPCAADGDVAHADDRTGKALRGFDTQRIEENPHSNRPSVRHREQIQRKEEGFFPKGFLFTIKKTIRASAHKAKLDFHEHSLSAFIFRRSAHAPHRVVLLPDEASRRAPWSHLLPAQPRADRMRLAS
jgi:hypothetical protein